MILSIKKEKDENKSKKTFIQKCKKYLKKKKRVKEKKWQKSKVFMDSSGGQYVSESLMNTLAELEKSI